MGRKLSEREELILRLLEASPTINSGATFGDGDGRIKFNTRIGGYGYNGILIEVKSTNANQFTLRRDILEKARKQSRPNRDLPILVVDFGQVDAQYVVMDLYDFTDLLSVLKEKGSKIDG